MEKQRIKYVNGFDAAKNKWKYKYATIVNYHLGEVVEVVTDKGATKFLYKQEYVKINGRKDCQ